jgi:hypothetical protein
MKLVLYKRYQNFSAFGRGEYVWLVLEAELLYLLLDLLLVIKGIYFRRDAEAKGLDNERPGSWVKYVGVALFDGGAETGVRVGVFGFFLVSHEQHYLPVFVERIGEERACLEPGEL